MSKVKYYYDPDTLSYRKIEPKKSKRYRNIVLFVLASALFGFLGLFLALPIVVTGQVIIQELLVKDIMNEWNSPGKRKRGLIPPRRESDASDAGLEPSYK